MDNLNKVIDSFYIKVHENKKFYTAKQKSVPETESIRQSRSGICVWLSFGTGEIFSSQGEVKEMPLCTPIIAPKVV